MPEDVKWSECNGFLEPDGQVPIHPSTGQPQFVKCKLKVQGSYLKGTPLASCPKGRIKVGLSQPDPGSNLTHLVLIWGDPEDLDPSVHWMDMPIHHKKATKTSGPSIRLKLEGPKLHRKGLLNHPLPLGLWKGALFIRDNKEQAMLALAHETMSAVQVLPTDPPGEQAPPEPPAIILPGDPRW